LSDNLTILLSNTAVPPPGLPQLSPTLNSRRSSRRDPVQALLGNQFRDGWSIQLTARAGNAEDVSNFVGVSANAQDGHDASDIEKPPALLGVTPTVDLSILQPDAQQRPTRYAIALHAPHADQQVWQLAVSTNQPNTPVRVQPDLSRLPRGYRAVLVDVETGQKRYLRTAAGYVYNSGSGGVRAFQLVVMKEDANPLRVQDVQVLQSRAGVGGTRFAVVLSRGANVRVAVHSVTGQAVAEMGLGARPGGVSTVTWDGKNQRGVSVGRGAYVVVVRATDESDGRTVQQVRTFTLR
jgi:hypothetical protein